ncbi:small conductance mechanosensitive channel [Terribacillus aidingensis]|uniref:Small conductance mechanosensitive channel n=1 Tax=Terribacillus aidingensis TaxID=586416 RepID=A0A285NIC0_9BACI|nr:mechanosensitive ion channel family protein [Terribacillus aidingensis]SNZ09195.1 small conductance mechanosensitive channel [Terribacillus aidingensis]
MNFLTDGLNFNYDRLIEVIISVGLQLLLIVIGYFVLRAVGKKLISSSLNKASTKQRISTSRMVTLEKLLLNTYGYTLIFLLVVMIFGVFDIQIGPLIAGAGIIGLAIGFGAQGLVSDVVTGFFILLERQIEVGDVITTSGYNGVVEEVGLRTTQVRSFDGTLNFIPNRNITGISNHSRGNMRAMVDIGISYEDDIDHALRVLQEICEDFQHDERFREGPDVIGVQELGASEVTLRIIGHTANMEQYGAERDMKKAIKEAFDKEGIEIPYPHQVFLQRTEESAKQ